MKQYIVEVNSSEIVRKTHTLVILAKGWEQAEQKAIHQVREASGPDVVVGNPTKISEEPVEEIAWPTGNSGQSPS